ncbi:hypothetical protein [Salinicoccus roseus]|uniref:hypothetical protein n=1 Tax=Salinicoccus roseus TaxID=45670 RepID=UPI000F5126B8|nr:hypothetical protein [Salinicoccus roseus]RPE54514.1 hypothetical protein EDC33_0770 [Salinicoccus roseus]GGA64926.1 hypothetical protein GCM10007176_06670 [Salinicoccus roseus]
MAKLNVLEPEIVEELLDSYQKRNNSTTNNLVKTLANYIGSYSLENRKGYKAQVNGKEVKFVILTNDDKSMKVIYSNNGGKENLLGSAISYNGEKEILHGYQIIDGNVQKVNEFEINEEFLKRFNQIQNNKEIPETSEGPTIQASCIYGNWCGPGCSGPESPISPVDTCCQSHDNCYGDRGYFACSCDSELQGCLNPYVLQGSEWAITISLWFQGQPCNPFA